MVLLGSGGWCCALWGGGTSAWVRLPCAGGGGGAGRCLGASVARCAPDGGRKLRWCVRLFRQGITVGVGMRLTYCHRS